MNYDSALPYDTPTVYDLGPFVTPPWVAPGPQLEAATPGGWQAEVESGGLAGTVERWSP